MSYQDAWFAFAGLFYTVAMIPAMLDKTTRVPWHSSATTAVLLCGSALCYCTLGMNLSALSCILGASAYFFMAKCRSGR